MAPLSICHFVSSSADGNYFEVHARAAIDRGMDVSFVSLGTASPPAWLSRVPQARYQPIVAHSRKHYPLAFAQLVTWLRRQRVDVLHTHLFDAIALGVPAAKLAGVPLVLIVRHHLDDAILAGARFQDRAERLLANLADCVVAPSLAVKRHLIDHDHHRPERVEHIYHGWDFSRLDTTAEDGARVRRELGIGPDQFLVGCIGRFSTNKGQEFLLRAVAELAPSVPGIRLLLVGVGHQDQLRQRVADLHLEGRVTILGWRTDVPACLRAMDVLVHPSLSEAFCQVIIEAMGVGIPVISTAVGGAPEVITDGQDGMLVPPRDASAIVRAIQLLAADADRRRQLAERGRALVRKRFTADQMTTAYHDLYARKLAGRPAPLQTRHRSPTS
jgi:glycosyltransferase involved in cell wall biosynthesis